MVFNRPSRRNYEPININVMKDMPVNAKPEEHQLISGKPVNSEHGCDVVTASFENSGSVKCYSKTAGKPYIRSAL